MSDHLYLTDTLSLFVPGGFRDRTLNVLEWTIDGDDRLAFVLQREPLLQGAAIDGQTPLGRYMAGQFEAYPAQFPGYRAEPLEHSAPDAPFEAFRRAFRWNRGVDVVYHHQAFLHVGSEVVVITTAAKAIHREAADRVLDEAVRDLRAREEAGEP